jgi:hypothetical protein
MSGDDAVIAQAWGTVMWQQVVHQIGHSPWLSQAAPWIEAVRGTWNALSSLFMVGGLFWISQRLKSERRKIGALVSEFAGELNDKIGMTAEIAKAARNSADAAAAAVHVHALSIPATAHEQWSKVHEDWHRIRDRIDLVVMNIKHPLQRKKYAGFGRDSYHHIIQALHQDGHLPAHIASDLLQMDERMRSLKTNPADLSSADIANFQQWMTVAESSLPRQH